MKKIESGKAKTSATKPLAKTVAKVSPAKKAVKPAAKAVAPVKKAPAKAAAKKAAPAKNAAAKPVAAKKAAPAKKTTPAKKTVAKVPAKKAAPAKKPVAKAPVKKTPAKVAAKKAAPAKKTAPAKKAETKAVVAKKAAPAKKAETKAVAAKKAPAKPVAAKKAAPAKKAPAKPVAAKKAVPAKKAPTTAGQPVAKTPARPISKSGAAFNVSSRKKADKNKDVQVSHHGRIVTKAEVAAFQNLAEANGHVIRKTHLSAKMKKHYRDMLLDLRAGYQDQLNIHRADALTNRKSGPGAGMATHMADLGSDNFQHDFELGLLSDEGTVIEMIDEALTRLDENEYGICIECGKEISPARLEVKPYARFCVACKSRKEANEGMRRR